MRYRLFILAAAVLVAGSVFAQGGGFLTETPSWAVKVKVSELPLRGIRPVAEYTGTGSWIAPKLVLTCWHNYRDTWDKPRHDHWIEDHKGRKYKVEIAAINKPADCMVLRVVNPAAIPIGNGVVKVSSEPQSIGPHWAYGFDSDGQRFRWSSGDLLADGGTPRRQLAAGRPSFHVTSTEVVQGMSGGPSFDVYGEITGINIGHYRGETTMVSLSVIQAMLDTIEP